MASTREIRRRIRSVRNISQVTRAMEAVAASKMRRAQRQVIATRPYAEKALEVLSHIARLHGSGDALDALITSRAEIKRVGIVLITADRGLAGGFNANVLKIRPPLVFGEEHVDRFLSTFEGALKAVG